MYTCEQVARDIFNAASSFRCSLDTCHGEFCTPFDRFPRGCCGDTASLLAAYFKDCGWESFSYISGIRNADGISHAWLGKDELLIDITADQFDHSLPSVMVTHDWTWHRQFSVNSCKQDADFRLEDLFTITRLEPIYDRVSRLASLLGR